MLVEVGVQVQVLVYRSQRVKVPFNFSSYLGSEAQCKVALNGCTTGRRRSWNDVVVEKRRPR